MQPGKIIPSRVIIGCHFGFAIDFACMNRSSSQLIRYCLQVNKNDPFHSACFEPARSHFLSMPKLDSVSVFPALVCPGKEVDK